MNNATTRNTKKSGYMNSSHGSWPVEPEQFSWPVGHSFTESVCKAKCSCQQIDVASRPNWAEVNVWWNCSLHAVLSWLYLSKAYRPPNIRFYSAESAQFSFHSFMPMALLKSTSSPPIYQRFFQTPSTRKWLVLIILFLFRYCFLIIISLSFLIFFIIIRFKFYGQKANKRFSSQTSTDFPTISFVFAK